MLLNLDHWFNLIKNGIGRFIKFNKIYALELKLKNDKEVVLKEFKIEYPFKNSSSTSGCANNALFASSKNELKNDKEVVLKAVQQN